MKSYVECLKVPLSNTSTTVDMKNKHNNDGRHKNTNTSTTVDMKNTKTALTVDMKFFLKFLN